MGTVCRKAVWGAALLLWLMPAAGFASHGNNSGKTDTLVSRSSSGGPRRVIVRVKPHAKAAVAGRAKKRGADIYGEHKLVNALSLRIGPEHLAALAADPDVESISADARVTSFASNKKSSANGDGNWSDSSVTTLKETLGLQAWFSGASVAVAIIDSGLQASDDFKGRILDFYDFTAGSGAVLRAPYDDYGHGTHVAGLIGSSGLTSSGKYEGVAPGVRLLPLKVLDKKGVGKTSDVISALEFVVANKDRYNVKIVNLSLGHPIYEPAESDPLVQAVEAAVRAGLIVVVASGNDGLNAAGEPGYGGIASPGNAPSAITVGAANTAGTIVRTDDRVAAYSSRGPSWYDGIAKPDILAPAQNLVSNGGDGTELANAYPWLIVQDGTAGKYLKLSGSSMATGVVSGLAVVMLEASAQGAYQRWQSYQESLRPKERTAWTGAPSLTPNAVKAMLQYTATPLRDADGAVYDQLTQGTGLANGIGALTLAYCTDTRTTPGADWLVYTAPPTSTFDGVAAAWSETLIWGTRILRGTSLVELNQSAWSQNIVWGTGDLDERTWGMVSGDGENIVWDTSVSVVEANWFGTIDFGENIVWGTLGWAENIVWGTGLLGFFNGENIVWGTWLGENIVWGTFYDENIVWGTSNKVTVLGSTLIGGEL